MRMNRTNAPRQRPCFSTSAEPTKPYCRLKCLQSLPMRPCAGFNRLCRLIKPTYRQVERYEQAFLVIPLTPAIVLEAVRGVRDYQLAYYDAQIWAAARLNQVPYVLSEDFNPGATLDGVTFLNPFAADFDLNSL